MKKKNVDLIYKKRLNPYEVRSLWLSRIFIWISIVLIIFPVTWILGASLSGGDTFFSGNLFPKHITFQNYKDVLAGTNVNFLGSLKISFIVCTSVSIIQVLMTSTAAYAFSRMRFRGRKNGLMALLILQMFPGMMAVSAIYTACYKLNLIDNIWALVLLLAAGSAFNVWLLKGYIDGLPIELDEAAKVDGASHFQIFWKIIMPLSKPMIAVMFFFSFQGAYNEYAISSVVLKALDGQTVVVTLRSFVNQKFNQNWTQFSAASILASIPLMIIFMLLQRFMEKGLASGAVKG